MPVTRLSGVGMQEGGAVRRSGPNHKPIEDEDPRSARHCEAALPFGGFVLRQFAPQDLELSQKLLKFSLGCPVRSLGDFTGRAAALHDGGQKIR